MAKKRVKAGTSKSAAAEKKRLFVEAYCTNGGNGKQAAITAGYAPKSAEVTASRLLRDAKVAGAVAIRRAQAFEKASELTDLTAAEVLKSLARDIRFDPAKMLDEHGNMKLVSEMDEDTRLALRGMEHFAEFAGRGENREQIGTTVKVKFPEKTAAREQGMKHFGLYELDNSQKPAATVNVGVLTLPAEAMNFEKVRARALRSA